MLCFIRRLLRNEETPLDGVLRKTIEKNGPLTIETFMRVVLQHPDYGYYRKKHPLGRSGDFVTSPETSQMFGEMIGAWCVQLWQQMGRPSPFVLFEIGPGSGALMLSLLSATTAQEPFHQALRLYLMDTNEVLKKQQTQQLSAFTPRHICQIDELPALPTIILANELFDTFPMRQIIRTENGWAERLVSCAAGRLFFVQNKTQDLPAWVSDQTEKPIGWVREYSEASHELLAEIAAHISVHNGGGLIFDYGYDEPRGEDTLFAIKKHKQVSIFEKPGDTDVTADVDFQAFKRTLESKGLSTAGPLTQRDFLLKLGIEARARVLIQNSPVHADNIQHEFFWLTSPRAMGSWLKVIGFSSVEAGQLPVFHE